VAENTRSLAALGITDVGTLRIATQSVKWEGVRRVEGEKVGSVEDLEFDID